MAGRALAGKYELIAQLGGGGMADVFLAKSGDGGFQKLAVVKRLKKEGQQDAEVEKMFHDEARLCARLNHPNIVQTFEVGNDEGGPFLVMEYIEGQSLSRLRARGDRRGRPITRRVALHILGEVLAALHYAHTLEDHEGNPLNVIHRDVSPQNIVVTYAGVAKLVDFGVAKNATSVVETRAGTFKGKVVYMAPEQVHAGGRLDARADVFSAGVLLWELLTGKRLWEGVTEVQVLTTLLGSEPLPPPRSVDPEIPEELDEICTKAMARLPEDRFASAADFLEALEGACRKLDLQASARDVSLVVESLFKEDRDKIRSVVLAAASRDSKSSLPSLVPPDGGGIESSSLNELPHIEMGSLRSPAVPKFSSITNLSSVSGANGVVDVTSPEPQRSAGRKPVFVIAAAIVAVAGIAGIVAVGEKSSPPTTARQEPQASPPSAAPTATQAPTAAAVPEEVTIDLSASPSTAKIFVDGQPVSGNPHRLRIARGSATHEIRAEADGYETKSTSMAFDRDRSIDLSLAKKQATATLNVAPPPPALPVTSPVRTPPVQPVAAPAVPPAPPHTAAPSSPAKPTGITELDPAKKPPKHDSIDTDVFKK